MREDALPLTATGTTGKILHTASDSVTVTPGGELIYHSKPWNHDYRLKAMVN